MPYSKVDRSDRQTVFVFMCICVGVCAAVLGSSFCMFWPWEYTLTTNDTFYYSTCPLHQWPELNLVLQIFLVHQLNINCLCGEPLCPCQFIIVCRKSVEVSTAPGETSSDDKMPLNPLFFKLLFKQKCHLAKFKEEQGRWSVHFEVTGEGGAHCFTSCWKD